jgi:uncharacterized linocin/CFP29 family protein
MLSTGSGCHPHAAHLLADQAVVDASGPIGWFYAASPLVVPGRQRARRRGGEMGRAVVPTEELRAPYTLSLNELDGADRGGNVELEPGRRSRTRLFPC